MTTSEMPLWLDLLISLLVVGGAGVALVGSWGLLTLPTFFTRMHPPALIATLGCWCLLHAALLYFWAQTGSPSPRVFLIALFVALTVPITSIFLMRAALFRARRAGADVPANLSGQASSRDANATAPGAAD